MVVLFFDTFRLKLIKIEPQHQKSIKIDNLKKVYDRLLSISDNFWLIRIDFYRQQSTCYVLFISELGSQFAKNADDKCQELFLHHRVHTILLTRERVNKGAKRMNSCWWALVRQQPILYNSEKKPIFVGCKIDCEIGDMRSRLCFLYPGIPGNLVSRVLSLPRERRHLLTTIKQRN